MAAVLRKLDELINRNDPGWPIVQEWIAAAKNHVEILPPSDNATREKALVNTQVTTRSPLGAVIYETGGILVDHGWILILGSGHPRLPRSLPDWNLGRSVFEPGQQPAFLLCADDVIGGLFAVDGGGLKIAPGKVCYFAPDQLAWENTNLGYSEFLVWCFQGDVAKFYQTERWTGWEKEIASLRGDEALNIYPFLWALGPPISERSRRPVPIASIYKLQVG
jgi:Protein of unknown function DUF2625